MYKDFCEPFVDPSQEEVFNMITKETPQTFYVGKLVMATVTGMLIKQKKPKVAKKTRKCLKIRRNLQKVVKIP